jgi:hypothetical protein
MVGRNDHFPAILTPTIGSDFGRIEVGAHLGRAATLPVEAPDRNHFNRPATWQDKQAECSDHLAFQ